MEKRSLLNRIGDWAKENLAAPTPRARTPEEIQKQREDVRKTFKHKDEPKVIIYDKFKKKDD